MSSATCTGGIFWPFKYIVQILHTCTNGGHHLQLVQVVPFLCQLASPFTDVHKRMHRCFIVHYYALLFILLYIILGMDKTIRLLCIIFYIVIYNFRYG